MNKHYNAILITFILSVATSYTLNASEQLIKPCIPQNYTLGTMVKNYILTHIALYSTIPVASAGLVKLLGSAPLKHSKIALKHVNFELTKMLTKAMPVTASLAMTYHMIQKNKE